MARLDVLQAAIRFPGRGAITRPCWNWFAIISPEQRKKIYNQWVWWFYGVPVTGVPKKFAKVRNREVNWYRRLHLWCWYRKNGVSLLVRASKYQFPYPITAWQNDEPGSQQGEIFYSWNLKPMWKAAHQWCLCVARRLKPHQVYHHRWIQVILKIYREKVCFGKIYSC